METTSYYETYWQEAGSGYRGRESPYVQRLFGELCPDGQVDCLDIGCGDGAVAGRFLQANARSYTGVDVSATALERARARGLAVRQISDAGDLPFDDASFGFILCLEVFEHLFETEAAAAEIKRVLTPGGYAVIQVPNVAHWRHRADLALRGRFIAGGDMETLTRPWRDPHIRFFTTSSLPALARHVGLEVVDVHGVASNGLKHLPVLRDRIRRQRAGAIASRLVDLRPGLFGERVRIIVRRGAD